jgi:hypothetical protein
METDTTDTTELAYLAKAFADFAELVARRERQVAAQLAALRLEIDALRFSRSWDEEIRRENS